MVTVNATARIADTPRKLITKKGVNMVTSHLTNVKSDVMVKEQPFIPFITEVIVCFMGILQELM